MPFLYCFFYHWLIHDLNKELKTMFLFKILTVSKLNYFLLVKNPFFYIVIFLIIKFFIGYICFLSDFFLLFKWCFNPLITFNIVKKIMQF